MTPTVGNQLLRQENQSAWDAIFQERQECLEWIDVLWKQAETFQNDPEPTDLLPWSNQQHWLPWLSKLMQDPKQCCHPNNDDNDDIPPSFVSPGVSVDSTIPSSLASQNGNGAMVLRPMVERELEELESNGCILNGNTRLYWLIPVKISSNVQATVACLRQYVRQTNFGGMVVLVWPTTTGTINSNPREPSPPPGLHNNVLVGNGVICHLDACVCQNGTLSNTYIASRATILNCGQFTASSWSPHHLQDIDVGPESNGGRPLVDVTPQDTLPDIVQQLTGRTTATNGNEDKATNATQWNVVGRYVQVRQTTTVHNVFLHGSSRTDDKDDTPTAARILSAAAVDHAVVFPTATIGSACHVSHVALQWQASAQEASHVTHALLMECSHVGPHAHVHHSVVGPDAALARGECHASVLGPCFAAHHQSLVISQFAWLGRCNVGYGANVGSNHTGRAPDQECIAGEGIFWGLSTVIVYPVNLSRAHYSLVAAGTKLVPQQISLPFSLVLNHNSPGSSQNEIVPGWILTRTPYTLARCQIKYQTRQKAQHHAHYTQWPLLDRRAVLWQCYKARHFLQILPARQQSNQTEHTSALTHKQNGKKSHEKIWYNDDSAGTADATTQKYLGKCLLSDSARQKAIIAYTDCLHRSALLALLSWLEEFFGKQGRDEKKEEDEEDLIKSLKLPSEAEQLEMESELQQREDAPEWPDTPWDSDAQHTWNFQKFVLVKEFELGDYAESGHVARAAMANLLHERLQKLEQHYVAAVIKSKHRDDKRGATVIPDYNNGSHVLVATTENDEQQQDKVIRHVQQEAQLCRARAEKVIALLHPDKRLS
mmetsp:Transcript_4374/g.12046  ORF Transcript_4374/g.12046 Transcript_4374/m.12046 type:complete len:827 (-) Transcript_4374:45-2525(-)